MFYLIIYCINIDNSLIASIEHQFDIYICIYIFVMSLSYNCIKRCVYIYAVYIYTLPISQGFGFTLVYVCTQLQIKEIEF